MSASFLVPRDAATDEENSEAASVSSSELDSLISNTEEVELPTKGKEDEGDGATNENTDIKNEISVSEIGELELFNACDDKENKKESIVNNAEGKEEEEEEEEKYESPQDQDKNKGNKEGAGETEGKIDAEEVLKEEIGEEGLVTKGSDTVVGREYKRSSLDWGDICEEEEKKKAEAAAKEEAKVNWADLVEAPDEDIVVNSVVEATNATNLKTVRNNKNQYKSRSSSDNNIKKTMNYQLNKNERYNKNNQYHNVRRRQRFNRLPDYDSDPNLTWRKKEEPKEALSSNTTSTIKTSTKNVKSPVKLLKKEMMSQPHGRYEGQKKKYEFKSKDDSWIDKKVILMPPRAEERGFKKSEKKGVVKEDDPCEIPTNGRFYMHDDRTSSNRRREPHYSRKEENSKLPEGKWKHDKFEELEREFEEKLKLERYGGKDLSHYYYKRHPNNKENNRVKHEDQYYADDEYYYEDDVKYKRREKTWNRSYLESNQQGSSSTSYNRKDRQQFSHLDVNFGSNFNSHIEHSTHEPTRDETFKTKKTFRESSKWLTVPSVNLQHQDRNWQPFVAPVYKDGYRRNDEVHYRNDNRRSYNYDQSHQHPEKHRNYKVYDEYEEGYISSPVFTEDIWRKVPETHDKAVSAEWHD